MCRPQDIEVSLWEWSTLFWRQGILWVSEARKPWGFTYRSLRDYKCPLLRWLFTCVLEIKFRSCICVASALLTEPSPQAQKVPDVSRLAGTIPKSVLQVSAGHISEGSECGFCTLQILAGTGVFHC